MQCVPANKRGWVMVGTRTKGGGRDPIAGGILNSRTSELSCFDGAKVALQPVGSKRLGIFSSP